MRRAPGRARCPARPSSPNEPRRQPEPLDQRRAPSRPCARRAGRSSRRSCASLASSPLSQRASRSGTSAIALRPRRAPRAPSLGQQLEDGVDRHRLDAGDRVASLARDPRVRALDHPVGARVAVVEREPEHAAALVEQRVVDAPGVDADAGAAVRAPRAGPSSASVNKCKQVPAQPVRQAHRPVREAVELLERARARRPAGRRPPGRSRRRGRWRRTQSRWKTSSMRRNSSSRSNSGAISACQRALTSVSSIARWAASKSSVSR